MPREVKKSLIDVLSLDWNSQFVPKFMKTPSKTVETTVPTNLPNRSMISADGNFPSSVE
jgi:hypothetical protein